MASKKPLVRGDGVEQIQSGDLLDSAAIDWASPGAIGSSTANTVTATTYKSPATQSATIVEYENGGGISRLKLINDINAKGAIFENTSTGQFVEFAFQVANGTIAYQSFLVGTEFRYTSTQSPLRNGTNGEFNYFLNGTRFVIGDILNISVLPLVCETNLTTPSVLLSNSGFASTILPGTLAASRSITLPTAAPVAGNFPFSTTTGGVLGWSTGLTYSTVTQTLTAASTGNNSALLPSASGTSPAIAASNTNATLSVPCARFTRSTSTAGVKNIAEFTGAGNSTAGNGGLIILNTQNSVGSNIQSGAIQWRAISPVIASATHQVDFLVSDFNSVAGRTAFSAIANGTRAFMSVPSGAGAAIGSATDPGANNLSIAGVVKLGVFTVATLPTASASGRGAIAHASNGRKAGEGAAAGTGVPVYCDNGTAWFTFYENTAVAA
jgi:hypothetical protein